MRKPLIILLLLLLCVPLYSQREVYNWYFGSGAGITFLPDGSTVSSLTDGVLFSEEGSAVVSDSSGNLLFYTNGETVWNKNHSIMVNGTGLNGSNSASQSVLIIPNPLRNGIYYIFTINASTRILSYSTVDIMQNNGTGAVTEKNVNLLRPVSEKMSAIIASTGYDYFLVVHGAGNNNFYTFFITETGVNTTPAITSVGSVHSSSSTNVKGQMKLSADGRTLAIVIPDDEKYEIFNFDNLTGRPSNPLTIDLSGYKPYGIEFSPDGTNLYVTTGNEIFQYDIEIRNADDINKSRVLLGTGTNRFHQLQLAPDGKIYIASLNFETLGRINKPNESGINADLTLSAVNLQTGTSRKGLPAFVQSYMTYIFVPSILGACEGEDVQLFCTVSRDENTAYYYWTGPDGFFSTERNPRLYDISLKNKGYYKVRVTLGSLAFVDSVYLNVKQKPKSRIVADGSTTICFGDSLRLYAMPDSSHYFYEWSTGEHSSDIIVSKAGKYYLTTSADGCMSVDSIEITVVPTFDAEIIVNGPKVICDGDSLYLEAKPRNEGNRYFWSTGDTTATIIVTKGGSYSVTIEQNGCMRNASVFIRQLPKPETKIEPQGPTSFCTGDSVILVAEPQNPEYSYLWSTGETSARIVVKQTGLVWLETISRNGCVAHDTIEISSGDELNVKIIKPDKPLCEGDAITLTVEPKSANFSYLWSTGDTSLSIVINKSGRYFVDVSAPGGCKGSDTVEVVFSPNPVAGIVQGDYAEICDGESITLEAADYNNKYFYLWSTGDTSRNIIVSRQDTYRLYVRTPAGCTDTAVFVLKVNPSPTVEIGKIQPQVLCRGDSVILYAKTSENNSVLWSTGEKSDTITVKATDTYSVKVTNQFGCTASDSIFVVFHPYEEPEIIPSGSGYICEGESIELKSAQQYATYLWNTGDTTSSITVTQPGTYVLTVTDTNGCAATAEYTVKRGENKINGIVDIDFGQVLLGSRRSEQISFWNLAVDTIVISDVYVLHDSVTYRLFKPRDTVRLGFAERYEAVLDFSPDELKFYPDSVVIKIESPCPETKYIKVEGYGSGLAEISMPDTSGTIGVRDFRIPMRANIRKLNEDVIRLTYSAKIKFDADIFLPDILTNGIIRHDTIIDGKRILSISDSNVILSRGVTVLTEISGTVLLGENTKSIIDIYDFQSDNPLLNFEIKDGSIEARAVCMQDISVINIGPAASMTISPNPATDYINIELQNLPDSDYTLKIYSVAGKLMKSLKNRIKNGNNTVSLDLADFPTGIYLVSYQDGIFSFSRLMVIIR